MPRGKKPSLPKASKRPIEQYDHKSKTRLNNPPVGLVTEKTDPPVTSRKTYAYDPHLDPQLVWAGKAEHTSFEVPTVSLHVHERIDPRTIIEAVRKRNGSGNAGVSPASSSPRNAGVSPALSSSRPAYQPSLFETKEENPPLREAFDFYRHPHGWTNRLIAGDSLLVMNSLLEKEGMAGQVQMVYIDPPYGIRYGSNFQPFVNRRDVKDGKDEDLTQEPEMVRAFRDTWELGIHSYLTYLRDRLLLARDLLHEEGSCFVQISDENVHHVREIMDDVFGSKNFLSQIAFRTSGSLSADVVSGIYDILVWYGRDVSKTKIRPLFVDRDKAGYQFVELPDGSRRSVSEVTEIPKNSRVYTTENLVSSGYTATCIFPIEFEGRTFSPSSGKSWKTTKPGVQTLIAAKRLQAQGATVRYVMFYDDYPVSRLTNLWTDLAGSPDKIYVVQTNPKVIQRCMLMTTDPGDIVFDPTCGSGTAAAVAEQWGRRWITCDTSRVATTLAKQRLMSATFDYYKLAHPSEGVGSGFQYKKVPHVTIGSIANNEPPGEETLYDQPLTDNSLARISGPFTVEAVPAPNVKSLDDLGTAGVSPASSSSPTPVDETPALQADASIARSGPTLRQSEWRDELLKSGIRGKNKQTIDFSRVEPLGGTRWLHADAETKGAKPERVVISFGPDYAPLEQRQVEAAFHEAASLHPRPEIIVFAAFQFDPEAAKDIDELTKEKTGMTFLTAQMNADLLTDDLKKKRSSNQSFWLVGRPDVDIREIKSGGDKGKFTAEVRGFDYYDTRNGSIESGGAEKIAMWLLDTDYDGRSLYPRQVFFPMADDDEGWAKLARNLKAEIDPDLIEHYRGTVSLPFALGEHKRIAVKVIDDRGIESLKVLNL
jgi:adenine-specific DNA-methyltransferase